jgi:hypothetical protein
MRGWQGGGSPLRVVSEVTKLYSARRKLFLRSQITLKFFHRRPRLSFRIYEFVYIYIYMISNITMYVTEPWVLVKTVLAAAVGFLPLEGFPRKICVFLFSFFSSFVLRDWSLVIRFSTGDTRKTGSRKIEREETGRSYIQGQIY